MTTLTAPGAVGQTGGRLRLNPGRFPNEQAVVVLFVNDEEWNADYVVDELLVAATS